VRTFSLPPEQAEDLHRLRPRAGVGVRDAGVELRDLTGDEDEVVVTEDQP
jgi:hypothetical protein